MSDSPVSVLRCGADDGIKRDELNEAQRARIAPLSPGKASDPGRTGADNRLFVNGCLWVLATMNVGSPDLATTS